MVTTPPSSHFGFSMQHLGLDLFSFGGKDYLICIDHWSGYPFYQLLCSLTSVSILKFLTSWFNLFGWSSSIHSNGGPQFHGDFSHFCFKHGIRHELSAPYNPKSNGLAEAGVKSVKNILRKRVSSGSDPDLMLYKWRNVPCSDGYSPTHMFGRTQRTCLPTLPSQVIPIDFDQAASSIDKAHSSAKLNHDRSKISFPLLSPGQPVFLQDTKSSAWDKQGFNVFMRPDHLSYIFNVDNPFFTRPRCLLRPVHLDAPTSSISMPAPVSSPPFLHRSPRIQSRVNTAVLQTPLIPSSSSSTSPSIWPSSDTDSPSLTTSKISSSSTNGAARPRQPLLPLSLPSTLKTRPTSQSATLSRMNLTTFPWISQTTASPSLTSTGRLSAQDCPQSSLSWGLASLLLLGAPVPRLAYRAPLHHYFRRLAPRQHYSMLCFNRD